MLNEKVLSEQRQKLALFLDSIPDEYVVDFVRGFRAFSGILEERDYYKKYYEQYFNEWYKLLDKIATLENEVAKLKLEVDGSRLNQLQAQLREAQDINQSLRISLSTKEQANKILSNLVQKLEDEKAALECVIDEKETLLKAMETVRNFFKNNLD